MPTISMFYGILIKMYSEPNSPHNVPHLHAEYQEQQAVYDFDGNILEGDLRKNKARLVEAWIEIHRDELMADWEILQSGNEYYKIEPLR